MSSTNLINGTCPKCGEKLEIPGHLKQFSCLYCGARLSQDEIVEKPAPAAANPTDASADVMYYRDHVLETITNHIGIEKEVTGRGYAPAFEAYLTSNEETFNSLNRAVLAGGETAESAAAWYLQQLEQRWNDMKNPRTAKKWSEIDKFVIAIFLVPMVRKLGLPVSEDFCAALHKQWMEKYPQNPFYLGTYEELAGGFNKKFLGLCYITTAICTHDGKPDNCAELTAFRNFRDGYLRSCPDGPALISEYYDVAPGIVMRIELSEDRDARYAAIRDTYLMPCYADLQEGNLKGCKARYVEMVRTLEQEYLS